MANVIPLPTARGASSPIGLFLRVGEMSYKQAEVLHHEGRLPIKHAIFDASKFKHQRGFAKTLREGGTETILDTKAAELAAPARYSGNAAGAPWADEKLHQMGDFQGDNGRALASRIARFAVEEGFDRVISPAHYLKTGVTDPWFALDLWMCETLRVALDKEGGGKIEIDYPVIIDQMMLRDESQRGALVSQLSDLPFKNTLIRASNFGDDASAPGLKEYINALDRLHNLGKPIIADHVGKLAGRAILAFGVASSIAHGLDEHERFSASQWAKFPIDRDDDERKGGRAKRVSVFGLDKSLSIPELNALARARGGHGLIVCNDPSCCRTGLKDMVGNSKGHSITQEMRSLAALNAVPDFKRAEHFLANDMANADRMARAVKELRPLESELKPKEGQTAKDAAEKLMARMALHARRTEKMRAVLENHHAIRGVQAPRVPPVHIVERVQSFNQKR
jgi:hypothetical protein